VERKKVENWNKSRKKFMTPPSDMHELLKRRKRKRIDEVKKKKVLGLPQGCQIFLDTMYQSGEKHQITTKLPNGHKIYQNGLKIFQLAIKYTNIFHTKALQNLSNLGFLV
jgi:hypothetical protein